MHLTGANLEVTEASHQLGAPWGAYRTLHTWSMIKAAVTFTSRWQANPTAWCTQCGLHITHTELGSQSPSLVWTCPPCVGPPCEVGCLQGKWSRGEWQVHSTRTEYTLASLFTVDLCCTNMQFLSTHLLTSSQLENCYLFQVVVCSPGVCRPSCLCWMGVLLGGTGIAANNRDSKASATGNMNMKYTVPFPLKQATSIP